MSLIKSKFAIFSVLPFIMILCFMFSTVSSNGQKVLINEDPEISRLMEKYLDWNKEERKVSGWRIQIVNTDDRRRMERELAKFRQEFPNVNYVKWKQVSPYYKVIIGAYDDKMSALAFLQEVKDYFHSAILIIDKIEKKELLGMK